MPSCSHRHGEVLRRALKDVDEWNLTIEHGGKQGDNSLAKDGDSWFI
jgi:hypothetical protein